jgi:trimeric autotransporter adhesin
VALSGDTLAVGAYLENSAAQGVGGNQGDNTATNSGAVYVFH